jgi:hypothetical protein
MGGCSGDPTPPAALGDGPEGADLRRHGPTLGERVAGSELVEALTTALPRYGQLPTGPERGWSRWPP